MPRNTLNDLNIANEPRKMPNLHTSDVMVCVECKKNSRPTDEGNYHFALKADPFRLETTIRPRRSVSF